MKVVFPKLQTEIEVPAGTRVSDACERAGRPLDLVCGGNGTCDKCRVDIIEEGVRRSVLGCQQRITSDIEVLVSAEEADHQLLETVSARSYSLDPHVKGVFVEQEALVAPMGGFDFATLAEALMQGGVVRVDVPSLATLKAISQQFHGGSHDGMTVVLDGSQIIDCLPGDVSSNLFGVAVDIGTTSVVAFLYRLSSGELLGHCSSLNGQCAYGADVISRIEHSEQPDGIEAEQDAITKTIAMLIERLCMESNIDTGRIYEVVYCGNSTMQHLFCGFSPMPLGRSPFVGLVSQEATASACDMDIPMNPNGHHRFMPLLGGFVGADTVACLLELPDDGKTRMLIDLGTNCEVSLGNSERFMVASTACGPALEGAGLSMGMRATDGAIESVSYDKASNRFSIGVIGNVAPIGFCGSGIIDLVATLLEIGIINRKGAFIKGKACDSHPLGERIVTSDEGRRFILVSEQEHEHGKEISITLKDIRAIQLAKSAICTGYTLLRDVYGIAPADIEEICLAGAFGNYINVEQAKSIGLLPDVDGVPIRSLGNGAGLGVQRYLLSEAERTRADGIRKATVHVELASSDSFMETYMKGMAFERNAMC